MGGLILINWSNGRVVQKAEPYALAAFLNRMQRLAAVPLLVGGDFERGASMRVNGTTVFPHAMAFGAAGDPAFTRFEGEVTAREARALGVHWVYYPVADVNNNPDNPIINIRSFGENPQEVAAHVKAFIEGAHSDKRNLRADHRQALSGPRRHRRRYAHEPAPPSRPTASGWSAWNWCPSARPSKRAWIPS